MSKQFTNSDKNITQTHKLNLQIQNVYLSIYNQQIFHKLGRSIARNSEEQAQETVRHLGMIYNTMGFAIKQAILNTKFTGQKQQKFQNFTKSNVVAVPVQAIYKQFPFEEQESEIKIKQKRQKAQKKLLQEMMAENDALNQQRVKFGIVIKPNLFMKQFHKNNFQNIQDIQGINDSSSNLQKSKQRQKKHQIASLRNQLQLGNCSMQQKHQTSFQKVYKSIESQQYEMYRKKYLIQNIHIKNYDRNICQFQQTDILIDTKRLNNKPALKQTKIDKNPLSFKQHYEIAFEFPQQKVGQVNCLKFYNVDKSSTKEKTEHKNNNCQIFKYIKDQQKKQQNAHNILIREQEKINQNKFLKMYETIFLDDYQQQIFQNPKFNHQKASQHHEESLVPQNINKIVKNVSKQGSIQNYRSTMKKKFRGQKLGKVCSSCNKFYQNGQEKQNYCQCRQLQSKSQRKRRFSQQICLSDKQ